MTSQDSVLAGGLVLKKQSHTITTIKIKSAVQMLIHSDPPICFNVSKNVLLVLEAQDPGT